MASSQHPLQLFDGLSLESKNIPRDLDRSQRNPREDNRHRSDQHDVKVALKEAFLLALNADMLVKLDMEPARETEAFLAFVAKQLSPIQQVFLRCAHQHFTKPSLRLDSGANLDPRGRLHIFFYGARDVHDETGIYKAMLNTMPQRDWPPSHQSHLRTIVHDVKDTVEKQTSNFHIKKAVPNFILTTRVYEALLTATRRPLLISRREWLDSILLRDFKFVWECFNFSVRSSRPVCNYWHGNGGKIAAGHALEWLEHCMKCKVLDDNVIFALTTVLFWCIRVEDNMTWHAQIITVIKHFYSTECSESNKLEEFAKLYLKVMEGGASEGSIFSGAGSPKAEQPLHIWDGVDFDGTGTKLKGDTDISNSVDAKVAAAAVSDVLEGPWSTADILKSIKESIPVATDLIQRYANGPKSFMPPLETLLKVAGKTQMELKKQLGLIVHRGIEYGLTEDEMTAVIASDREVDDIAKATKLLLQTYVRQAEDWEGDLMVWFDRLDKEISIVKGRIHALE